MESEVKFVKTGKTSIRIPKENEQRKKEFETLFILTYRQLLRKQPVKYTLFFLGALMDPSQNLLDLDAMTAEHLDGGDVDDIIYFR